MPNVNAEFIFSGFGDYWAGHGQRWDSNAGCAFAYYGKDTTLRDIVDQLVEDFSYGSGDFDDWPEDITTDDVRQAVLDMLTEKGRADYESGAISEFAQEYAAINDLNRCTGCGEYEGDEHNEELCGTEGIVLCEDCCDDETYAESPVIIVLLTYDACPDCGKPSGEDTWDDLCDECYNTHYRPDAGRADPNNYDPLPEVCNA